MGVKTEMGGPCLLSGPGAARKVLGPACTDNFQIVAFTFQGRSWHSVEQCYQAMKYPEGSDSREKLESCQPLPAEADGSCPRLGEEEGGDNVPGECCKVQLQS